MYQYFIPFYGLVLFHCVGVPYFICLSVDGHLGRFHLCLTFWGTARLFPTAVPLFCISQHCMRVLISYILASACLFPYSYPIVLKWYPTVFNDISLRCSFAYLKWLIMLNIFSCAKNLKPSKIHLQRAIRNLSRLESFILARYQTNCLVILKYSSYRSSRVNVWLFFTYNFSE